MIFQKQNLLLIGFIAGVLAGGAGSWQFANLQSQERDPQQEKTIARLTAALEEVYPPLEERERILTGVVTAVGESELTVEASIRIERFPQPDNGEFEAREMTVIAVGETEIQKATKEGTTALLFGDIEEGMNVFVEPEFGFVRETANTVIADRITIFELLSSKP